MRGCLGCFLSSSVPHERKHEIAACSSRNRKQYEGNRKLSSELEKTTLFITSRLETSYNDWVSVLCVRGLWPFPVLPSSPQLQRGESAAIRPAWEGGVKKRGGEHPGSATHQRSSTRTHQNTHFLPSFYFFHGILSLNLHSSYLESLNPSPPSDAVRKQKKKVF